MVKLIKFSNIYGGKNQPYANPSENKGENNFLVYSKYQNVTN